MKELFSKEIKENIMELVTLITTSGLNLKHEINPCARLFAPYFGGNYDLDDAVLWSGV